MRTDTDRLLRAGYDYVPYSSLESIIEQNKDSYYLALRGTQVTIRNRDPDWNHLLDFFLNALAQQKARLEKKIERERLVLGDLPDLSVQILELTRDRGRITVAEAAKLTGANRNTIKDHLSALTRAGHIARHGKGRGTWYGLIREGLQPDPGAYRRSSMARSCLPPKCCRHRLKVE